MVSSVFQKSIMQVCSLKHSDEYRFFLSFCLSVFVLLSADYIELYRPLYYEGSASAADSAWSFQVCKRELSSET